MTREEFIEKWKHDDFGEEIIKDLNSLFPPAEGAEKSCLSCRFHNSPTYHDKMWCRDCQQFSHYKPQPTAEGAENVAEEVFEKAESFLQSKDIWNHPYISDRENKNGYEVTFLIAEFATLHAQRLAEKMVEEKMREELIAYDKWLNRTRWGMKEILSPEKAVERYLKSKEQWHY